MTEKQKIFIREYLKDFNGTRAYKAAYPDCSEESARRNASRLLTNDDIQKAIREQADKQLEKIDIDVNDILRELKAIAFADRTKISRNVRQKLMEDDGRVYYEDNVIFTETDELDEDTKKIIAGYKKTQSGFAVETYDKMKALELLGKYIGMFSENINVNDSTKATSLLESINKQLSDK